MNKKICFFSGNIERSGGTERVSTLIANELSRRGYQVIILSYQFGEKSFFKLDDNIKLYTLINDKKINKLYKELKVRYMLYKFIKEHNVDVIIDIDIYLSLYTVPLKLFSNLKVISWEHFNLLNNNGVKKRDYARILASKFSDKIIVLTKEDEKNYRNKFKSIKNIEYIYNPSPFININLNDTKKEQLIISVGRLTKVKGFDSLIKAWSLIEKENPTWKLYIIGSGEEKENLLKDIKRFNLVNIRIIPFTNNILDFYKKASIYVLSSRYEGFPMVLLEAKSCALPIISFNCKTGPKEIITNEVDGILVENQNVKQLAKAMNNLIKNDKVRYSYSMNSKESVEKFSIKNIVDKWEKIINNL